MLSAKAWLYNNVHHHGGPSPQHVAFSVQLLTSPNNRISLTLPCKSWRVTLTCSDYSSILSWTGYPVPRPLPTSQFAQYFCNHALAMDTRKTYCPPAALPPSSERALASSRIDLLWSATATTMKEEWFQPHMSVISDRKQHWNTQPRTKGYNVMLYVTPTDAHL